MTSPFRGGATCAGYRKASWADTTSRLSIWRLLWGCRGGKRSTTQGFCLETLDRGAAEIGEYTERVLPLFYRNPERYEHSEAYFRVLVMITVLQRDYGVRYNPEKIPLEARFETADSFIHGAIQGQGGTCATLPIVYAAVGRRLGYPIKLVSARVGDVASHCFARWDGDSEQFNIEASAQGLSCPPDDYYRTGRYEITPEVEPPGVDTSCRRHRGWNWRGSSSSGQWYGKTRETGGGVRKACAGCRRSIPKTSATGTR